MSRGEAANTNGGAAAVMVRHALFRLLEATPEGCPVIEVVAALVSQHTLSRALIRQIVRCLITEGEIEYRYHCGQTCLARSFQGARRVATRFVIMPPGVSFAGTPGLFPLVIDEGAAFGDGRHPTTRLALRGLEGLRGKEGPAGNLCGARCLDIGTGSGILAIAAARLGAAHVVALDIDPCAVAAARHNIALNGVSSLCTVIQQPLDQIEEDFDVVLANLRPPTLALMSEWVGIHLRSGGATILSGFRPEETAPVAAAYAAHGMAHCWQAEDAGWGALAVRKPAPLSLSGPA